MPLNITSEKKKFCKFVKIDKRTYESEDKIDLRIGRIFSTFARTLHGRNRIKKKKRELEVSNIILVIKNEIILPFLKSHRQFLSNQKKFDNWHRKRVNSIKEKCRLSWDQGSIPTVGMCQKLINLVCKDIWALDLIRSSFIHPIIDQYTLEFMGRRGKFPWTKLDSYEKYMEVQYGLRKMSINKRTYPIVLECMNWNREIEKRRKKLR